MPASEQRSASLSAETSPAPATGKSPWARELSGAIRDASELRRHLGLPPATTETYDFPVLVPMSFVERMRPGDPADPLLRQVLPVGAEGETVPGFGLDAVGDHRAKQAPGLIQKYPGRVLLIAAGSCAVNCRYCFRRHYPYGDDPRRLEDWDPAIDAINSDQTIREVILSGGDPLMLTDGRLESLIRKIEAVPHVRRLRVHSRLPIVLPSRMTDRLRRLLIRGAGGRPEPLRTWLVVHSNHANELVGSCAQNLAEIVQAGIPVLNQSVFLKGVNDSADAIVSLCERLVDLGVQPYYLHLLDRVAGTAHFEIPERDAIAICEQVRRRLPGYAVPTLVREIPGRASKTPIA